MAATPLGCERAITRFANPRQPMASLGLVPSDHPGGGTLFRLGQSVATTMLEIGRLVAGDQSNNAGP